MKKKYMTPDMEIDYLEDSLIVTFSGADEDQVYVDDEDIFS